MLVVICPITTQVFILSDKVNVGSFCHLNHI